MWCLGGNWEQDCGLTSGRGCVLHWACLVKRQWVGGSSVGELRAGWHAQGRLASCGAYAAGGQEAEPGKAVPACKHCDTKYGA